MNQIAEQLLFVHQPDGFVISAVGVFQHPRAEGTPTCGGAKGEEAEDGERPMLSPSGRYYLAARSADSRSEGEQRITRRTHDCAWNHTRTFGRVPDLLSIRSLGGFEEKCRV
jgi:hypothetical protein